MGVRVCGWQRVIVASGAAWAPCCYPATLQAGHAFSGFCGSAAAPFTALHHPVREHPAPHKRLHIRRARTHTHTHTHAHARTHAHRDRHCVPNVQTFTRIHITHTHAVSTDRTGQAVQTSLLQTHRKYYTCTPATKAWIHTSPSATHTHTHTHTHAHTHQRTHPPIPCLSPPAAAVYITSHWLYPSWRLCLSRVCVCDVCVWCVCYWQLSLSVSTNETVTFDVLCLDKSEW